MKRPWAMPACTPRQSWTSGWRARSGGSICSTLARQTTTRDTRTLL
nr:hypothetical protein Iba_chr14cCG5490 [Ipomoea batatas]